MTNKQIMADLGQALLISELKTPDKFTNTGVTYGDTTTINSRSINMASYDGVGDYQTFDGSQIKLDKKILSFWLKPDFANTYGSNRGIVNLLNPTTLQEAQFNYDTTGTNALRFAIFDGSPSTTITAEYTTAWSIDDLLHIVIFADNIAGLESSNSLEMYVNGVSVSTNTTTWTASFLPLLSYIGRGLSTYYDGGLYDFCIYDYQDDQFLRDHSQANIVNALYNNAWGSSPAYLFSHEYRYLQDIAKLGNNNSSFKVQLKKRSNTSLTVYDSSFTDITSYVNSIGDIEIGLQDSELDYGEITIDNLSINFDNKLGYFNDNEWSGSLWFGAYALQNSYMRVSLGFTEIDSDGLEIRYLEPIFKGIVSEPDIDYSAYPSVEIELLSYINLIDQRYVHEIEIGLNKTLTANSFLYYVFSQFIIDFGGVFGLAYSGATIRDDYIMSRSENINESQYEVVGDIIEKTGAFIIPTISNVSINNLDNITSPPTRQPFQSDGTTEALWYFEETSGDYLDETANNNDLTSIGLGVRGVDTILGTGYRVSTTRNTSLAGVPDEADICYEMLISFDLLYYSSGQTVFANYPNGFPLMSNTDVAFTTTTSKHQIGLYITRTANLGIKYGGQATNASDILEIEDLFAQNQWYYIAVNISYTSGYIEIFVNGKKRRREYVDLGTGNTYGYFQLSSGLSASHIYTIDSMRISSALRTPAEISAQNGSIFKTTSPLGNNIGTFLDYSKDENLYRESVEYETGLKQIRNYIVSEGNAEQLYLGFTGTSSGSGSEKFRVYIDTQNIEYVQGVDYTDIETLVFAINEDFASLGITAIYKSPTEFDMFIDEFPSSNWMPIVFADLWTSAVFSSGDDTPTVGRFSEYLNQQTLLASDPTSIAKYGKHIEKVKNEQSYIQTNEDLKSIAESILANKKDKKFSIAYDARYLENLFTPGSKASVFSQASINLDDTIGENGAYNGSPTIAGVARDTKLGGYIPWADRETTKDIWITGLTISPDNKTVTWRGRET